MQLKTNVIMCKCANTNKSEIDNIKTQKAQRLLFVPFALIEINKTAISKL